MYTIRAVRRLNSQLLRCGAERVANSRLESEKESAARQRVIEKIDFSFKVNVNCRFFVHVPKITS
jgi:ribosomal protein L19E